MGSEIESWSAPFKKLTQTNTHKHNKADEEACYCLVCSLTLFTELINFTF